MIAHRKVMIISSILILGSLSLFGCVETGEEETGSGGGGMILAPCTQLEDGLVRLWGCENDLISCLTLADSGAAEEICENAFGYCAEFVMIILNKGYGDFGEVYGSAEYEEALSQHMVDCHLCDLECQDFCEERWDTCMESAVEPQFQRLCNHQYYNLCLGLED